MVVAPLLFLLVPYVSEAQNTVFTHQDSLRGSITPERAWWDLLYYHLQVEVNPSDSSLQGSNTIQYKVLQDGSRMQIDLQPPLNINKVTQNGKSLKYTRDGNAYFIDFPKTQNAGEVQSIVVEYGGRPRVAQRPPWDGGLTWSRDSKGKPFIATSCQGIGASIWWPCKDHMYDEPDSMLISVTVPEDLIDVSNGRLRGIDRNRKEKTKTYNWFVSNPINNYGVNLNVGDYVHFGEKYPGEKGNLDCDYWVLKEDLDKARQQFVQVPKMLEAFEYWFGPYPFYEDSYKLVEVPYLGMEHQSSVTYGNKFGNGYLGRDLSGTGWGLKFDYIIIHESAHEWFANNITYKDIADMWIHESFTMYSESLYVRYFYGDEAGDEYVLGIRSGISNNRPIIGPYGVNKEGSDLYNKGANMLHTLAQIVNDKEKWRGILRGLNKEFYHQTVTTAQIENFLSKESGLDLSSFFDQYLRTTQIPIFEYRFQEGTLAYRWTNVVQGFTMPFRIYINGEEKWITPSGRWQRLSSIPEDAVIKTDPNFYIAVLNELGK